MNAATETTAEPRLSLLIELAGDRPGALEAALHPFTRHGVSLTHIESRPRRGETFDFYVDCIGERGEPAVEAVIATLQAEAVHVIALDHRDVPWFPREVGELDAVVNHTLDAGVALDADHPGFRDPDYRERRAAIDRLAREYRHGGDFPVVDYTPDEDATWREVYQRLAPLHQAHACAAYRRSLAELTRDCAYGEHIPQGRDVSAFLAARTGFRLRPVAGLLRPRDFLNGLAFRVFFATQYIRHGSKPFYTPEPDVCHELIGHAPMFADPDFADLSQEIGLASLGADDADVERLARCYWFSIEFGLLAEAGDIKAYGAGLLSSYGELEHACRDDSGGRREPWDPVQAAERAYPVTEYQSGYFVAASLHDARTRMHEFCQNLARPFYARYHPATERIWVDRAVRRV